MGYSQKAIRSQHDKSVDEIAKILDIEAGDRGIDASSSDLQVGILQVLG